MEVLTSSHPSKAINSNYFDVPSTRYDSKSYQPTTLERSHYRVRNPPTPPRDNSLNMSLPPISSLLSLSRDESRTSDYTSHQHPHYPPSRDISRPGRASAAGQRDENRSNTNGSNTSQHLKLPPTPPMQSYVASSQPHSPPQSQRPQPPPLTTSGVLHYDPVSHAHNYRHILHSQAGPERSFSPQASYSPHAVTATPLGTLPSPATALNGATTPHSATYHPSPLSASQRNSHQRPLPTDFPPPIHPPTLPSQTSQNRTSPTKSQSGRVQGFRRQSPKYDRAHSPASLGTAPNQQSSLASASSHAPPLQERYVCPTCGKAFSRPSSLRIHGHSHTGEKPFKCPHKNCGKAFSVRSNMKRHEKGCHAERERRLDMGSGGASRELLPAAAS